MCLKIVDALVEVSAPIVGAWGCAILRRVVLLDCIHMGVGSEVSLLPRGLDLGEAYLPVRIKIVEPLEDPIKCRLGVQIHATSRFLQSDDEVMVGGNEIQGLEGKDQCL